MNPSTAPTPQQIKALHETYCALTGFVLSLDYTREQAWYWWAKRGLTVDDLRLVISHIRTGIRSKKRNEGALKFRNLIGQPDFFEEDLQEAKALARRPQPMSAGRATALRATGREIPTPQKDAQPVAAVSEKALSSLREFNEKLKRGEV